MTQIPKQYKHENGRTAKPAKMADFYDVYTNIGMHAMQVHSTILSDFGFEVVGEQEKETNDCKSCEGTGIYNTYFCTHTCRVCSGTGKETNECPDWYKDVIAYTIENENTLEIKDNDIWAYYQRQLPHTATISTVEQKLKDIQDCIHDDCEGSWYWDDDKVRDILASPSTPLKPLPIRSIMNKIYNYGTHVLKEMATRGEPHRLATEEVNKIYNGIESILNEYGKPNT